MLTQAACDTDEIHVKLNYNNNIINAADRCRNSEAGQACKDSMTRRSLQGLALRQNGMRQMSANKPLLSRADTNGLKFRVQTSNVPVTRFMQLSTNPQEMTFKEVCGALQTTEASSRPRRLPPPSKPS